MFVLSIFLTSGEAPGLAGLAVGAATGVPVGDATGLATTTGVGVAAGLFGVSGLFSHEPRMATVVANIVVNISFLIVFLHAALKLLESSELAVRGHSQRSRMKFECLSANRGVSSIHHSKNQHCAR